MYFTWLRFGLCELENRGQLNLMVISKNIKEETYFLSVLEHLSCYVLLALPHSLSSTMLPIVSFKWLNTSLFYGEIPMDHIGIFGLDHQLKSRKETVAVSDGLDRTQKLVASEIGLFWDIEDCQPDNVGNPDRLYSRTKSALWDLGYRGHLSIMVYVDMEKEDLCYTFQDSRIKLRVTEGGKYAKATKMLVDMLFWAMNRDVSSNLMLISKTSEDMKSDSVLQALEAKGFNVLLRPSEELASRKLLTSECFQLLCKSLSLSKPKSIKETFDLSNYYELPSIRNSDEIRVFWDVEDCPTDNDPDLIYKSITSTLKGKCYRGSVYCQAYPDEKKFKDELFYLKAGIVFKAVPEVSWDKYAKRTMMLLDILFWEMSCYGPSNVLIISKTLEDAISNSVFECLKARGTNVLLAHPDDMIASRSSVWSAKSLLEGRRG